MLDPRIYRAGLLPVLFVLILAAFSLRDRPSPLPTPTLASDAFDGRRAFRGLETLERQFPSRRPGSAGDLALAHLVARELRSDAFKVHTVHRSGETVGGRRDVETVIGERTGNSDERVVVVAHRDAAGRGAAAELSGTAGLLELARVFGAPRRAQRTITLVSTSGGSGGVGARALADALKGQVTGVLVLGDLASTRLRRPLVSPWSDSLGGTPIRLRRTVEEAVRIEAGESPGAPGALTQFVRLALPGTPGEQGVLLAHDLPAVLLSATGERTPAADSPVSQARLQAFGRAALRTVTALDAGPSLAGQSTTRDLIARRKVLPGWAVRLFVGVLLLPVALTAIDAFARARRRREPVGAWTLWALSGAVPFLVTAFVAFAMGITGLLPSTPNIPVPTSVIPVKAAALFVIVLALVLSWLGVRPAVLRAAGVGRVDPASPAASAMLMLVLTAAVTVVWIANPYAAALLVPAAHLWLFVLSPGARMRSAAAVAVVLAGLVPLAIAIAIAAHALGLGIAGTAWVATLVVAGGGVGPVTLLGSCVVAGCAASAVVIAAHGRDSHDAPPSSITVRGPGNYAGPGSLGGTESALRR